MTEMYDDQETVEKTFDQEFLNEYLRQAQWSEMIELKKVITEISDKKGRPITILDIGIGNARVPKHLSGIEEIWEKIGRYDGIDNAENCVELTEKVAEELGIEDKVTVQHLDASNIDKIDRKYDLVITTWFTAGNFYPDGFDFEAYKPGSLDLSRNEKFEKVFRQAYEHLEEDGEVVIGSCYIDNPTTRRHQEDFYRKCGWTLITGEEDTFTAVKEMYWSQRFTQERLQEYLNFVDPEKIEFLPLDTYDYAMMVRIKR